MSMSNAIEATDLRIYASGSGALIILNLGNVKLTAEDIVEFVNEHKPHLRGWVPFNENHGHPAYWGLYHPFQNLTGDIRSYPMVIVDQITNKTYKVVVDESEIWDDGFIPLHALTLIGSLDGHRYEVKNLSLRASAHWWLNNRKRFE